MKKIIIAFSALLMLSAFTLVPVLKSYTGELYSFKYPDTWLVVPAADSLQIDLYIYPPDDDDATFNENINILNRDMEGHQISLADYDKLSIEEIKKMFADMKIVSSGEKSGINGKYYDLVYTASYEGMKLKFKQQFMILNGYAFVLTYTATAKTYQSFIKDTETIFKSFKRK